MICLSLVTLFFGVNCLNMEANALFGNTHFNLGKKIIEKLEEKPSKNEEDAFLSGMVYADIGRFKFDKETGVDSDSDKFANEMEKLAQTNEEKWFAYGFRVHVFQDNETKKFLNDVLDRDYSSYSEYMMNCGVLDSYFSKKSGILYNEFLNKFNFKQITSGWDIGDLSKISGAPEDKIEDFAMRIIKKHSDYPQKNNLLMHDDLVQRTYKSLGFEISLDDIHEQAGNLLGVFIIVPAVVGSKCEISEELSSKIEEKSDTLADLCISNCKFIIGEKNEV